MQGDAFRAGQSVTSTVTLAGNGGMTMKEDGAAGADEQVIDPHEEAVLATRDARVSQALRDRLDALRGEAIDLREQAASAERAASRIEKAVKAGWWWKLTDVLSEEDIESLCNVEPYPRSSLLTDDLAVDRWAEWER